MIVTYADYDACVAHQRARRIIKQWKSLTTEERAVQTLEDTGLHHDYCFAVDFLRKFTETYTHTE